MACELKLGTLVGVAGKTKSPSSSFLHKLKSSFPSAHQFTFISLSISPKKRKHLPHLMKLLDFEALFFEEAITLPQEKQAIDFLYRSGKNVKTCSLSKLVLEELAKEMKYTQFTLLGSSKTTWIVKALGGKKSSFVHKLKAPKENSLTELLIEIAPQKTKAKKPVFISYSSFQKLKTLMALKLIRGK